MATRRSGASLRWAHYVVGLVFALPLPLTGQTDGLNTSHRLRGRVEALRGGVEVRAADQRIFSRLAVPAFYEARGFEPVWTGGPEADERLSRLVGALNAAADHGLDPSDYHRDPIDEMRSSASLDPSDIVDLEVLASDAFMLLGSHLLHGRVNPETIDPEWLANRRSAELHLVLEEAVAGGDIAEALLALAPRQPRYRAMMAALRQLSAVQASGGWPRIAEGPRMEIGVEGERVAALRARLGIPAPDDGEASSGESFDDALAEAVRDFQRRHGLDPDGVVGPATLAALNVSAADRARQIALNMERWRWLPAELGERHIEVNIAGFDVQVVERGETVRRHRAVVGRQYRQTPMFSGTMTYLVLAPYWHVPPTIAAVDKFPLIQRDFGYIAEQRMTLLDQRTNEPVDPASVDWSALNGAGFNRRYRLRQDPGPANALGQVKFMFPNRHNVYLHDTPSRELFQRTSRNFSSGCIRIDDPLGLAEYLLADQPQWDRSRIEEEVAGGTERTVRLSRGVPVHLLYWTAWADEDGVLHFRPDVYGRDPVVERALEAAPPGL